MTRVHIINHFPATLGDRALLRAVVKGVRETIPDSRVSVASFLRNHEPLQGIEFSPWLINIESINEAVVGVGSQPVERSLEHSLDEILSGRKTLRGGMLRSLEGLMQADVVIVCPGGYFTDKYPFVNSLACVNISAATKLGKKTIAFPSAYGPFTNKAASEYFIKTMRNVDKICARDRKSLSLLLDNGIGKKRVCLRPDVALTLEDTWMSDRESDNGPIVGVTPVNFSADMCPESSLYERYVRAVAGACDLLIKKNGASVVLLPMNQFMGLDAAAANDIYGLIRWKNRVTVAAADMTLDEFCGILSGLSLLLATRYHSMILGTVHAIPFVSIAYELKISEFMNDAGLGDYCFELEDVSPEGLYEKASEILGEEERFKNRMKKLHSKLSGKAKETFSMLVE